MCIERYLEILIEIFNIAKSVEEPTNCKYTI
nr:MAG TPA: hypothetical protein [Bacteriophage sp.]